MIVERSVGPSLLQVAFEPGPSSFMQRNQPAFTEFGTADHQTVGRDVVVSQPDGLRDTKSRTGQQREKRTVGLPAQSAVTRLRSQANDLTDLFLGEDVRSRSGPPLAAEDRGRYLVTCIFRCRYRAKRATSANRRARDCTDGTCRAHSIAVCEFT